MNADESKRMQLEHGMLKNSLIENIINKLKNVKEFQNNRRVYDIACGKGNDMFKYYKLGVKAYGIDINSNSIASAISRRDVAKTDKLYKSITGNRVHEFYTNTIYNVDSVRRGKFYITVCFFAIHYFFDSKEHLKDMLRHVYDSLHIGGYFVTVFADANMIKKSGVGEYTWRETEKDDFGQTVSVFMPHLAYFENGPIQEYFVYEKNLMDAIIDAKFTVVEKDSFNKFIQKSNKITNAHKYIIVQKR